MTNEEFTAIINAKLAKLNAMSDERLAAAITKTAASLSHHAARGATVNNQRSYDLIDRFGDLKDIANSRGAWRDFCERRGWDAGCDGYDFFA